MMCVSIILCEPNVGFFQMQFWAAAPFSETCFSKLHVCLCYCYPSLALYSISLLTANDNNRSLSQNHPWQIFLLTLPLPVSLSSNFSYMSESVCLSDFSPSVCLSVFIYPGEAFAELACSFWKATPCFAFRQLRNFMAFFGFGACSWSSVDGVILLKKLRVFRCCKTGHSDRYCASMFA